MLIAGLRRAISAGLSPG